MKTLLTAIAFAATSYWAMAQNVPVYKTVNGIVVKDPQQQDMQLMNELDPDVLQGMRKSGDTIIGLKHIPKVDFKKLKTFFLPELTNTLTTIEKKAGPTGVSAMKLVTKNSKEMVSALYPYNNRSKVLGLRRTELLTHNEMVIEDTSPAPGGFYYIRRRIEPWDGKWFLSLY